MKQTSEHPHWVVAMSGASPENVEAAIATVDPNGPDRRHALSAIVRWQTEGKVFGDREDLVRLYLALKQCRSSEEQCGKITLGLLCSWQRTIKMSVTVTRGFFFLVDRSRNPALNQQAEVTPWLTDPSCVSEWPNHVDPADVWLVDDGCPRHLLGTQVLRLKLSVKDERKSRMLPETSSEKASASGKGSPFSEPAPGAQALPPPAPVRLLAKRDSAGEEEAAELIAGAVKEALEANRISVKDHSIV